MQQESVDRRISRRTLAKGTAWMVPTVAVAAAAPAFAVSGPCSGCYEMSWGQHGTGIRVGGQTFSTTGEPCAEPPTATVAVNRGGTAGSVSGTNASTGLHSRTFNGVIDYRGEQVGYPANTPFPIAGVSAANPGLILNIGHSTTTTVTLTFSRPISSAVFPVHDLTRSTNTQSSNAYRYTDTLAFDQPTEVSGASTSTLNRSTAPAGQSYSRTGHVESSRTDSRLVTFTTTSTSSFSSITLTYSAPQSSGWQFIALGNLSLCV